MAVCRVEKNKNYTTMSNYHLRDPNLSNKARGLLSTMLSLPESWDYTTRGLAKICKDGVDGITAQLRELEQCGYLIRNRIRDSSGRIVDMEYIIYERPHPASPDTEKPDMAKPDVDLPCLETPAQINIDKRITDEPNTDLIKYSFHSFRRGSSVCVGRTGSRSEKKRNTEIWICTEKSSKRILSTIIFSLNFRMTMTGLRRFWSCLWKQSAPQRSISGLPVRTIRRRLSGQGF